jgi:hypothetical protein
MIEARRKILDALSAAGISQVITKRSEIPDSENLPAAIVLLKEEEGAGKIKRKYVKADFIFDIYLVVDGTATDPDGEAFTAKEKFREAYLAESGDDFESVDYYDTKINKTQPAKVAHMDTRKSR